MALYLSFHVTRRIRHHLQCFGLDFLCFPGWLLIALVALVVFEPWLLLHNWTLQGLVELVLQVLVHHLLLLNRQSWLTHLVQLLPQLFHLTRQLFQVILVWHLIFLRQLPTFLLLSPLFLQLPLTMATLPILLSSLQLRVPLSLHFSFQHLLSLIHYPTLDPNIQMKHHSYLNLQNHLYFGLS